MNPKKPKYGLGKAVEQFYCWHCQKNLGMTRNQYEKHCNEHARQVHNEEDRL